MSTTIRRNNRRPPRDPSAATRPKNALEAAAMKSLQFRLKVQQANATTICNSASEHVGRMPMKQILASDTFCVPIFQRRYCWTKTQWETLLEDAQKGTLHSLGRLTCTRVSSQESSGFVGVEGRSCILDGQQRFTTVTILLAAIRDLLMQLADQEDTKSSNLIRSIDALLFSDPAQLRAFLAQQPVKLEEGAELPFARLIPSFCDRRSYYATILPSGTAASIDSEAAAEWSSKSTWHRPLQAKNFFMKTLRREFLSVHGLQHLFTDISEGLTMLYFPINVQSEVQGDGTDDLMVIYERLALRDATFCKPTRGTEYQPMDGADMIRNLLLGSFANSADALDFYKEFWLPLEELTSSDGSFMKDILQAFLDAQCLQEQADGEQQLARSGVIGGQIYADFQAWFATRLGTTPSCGNEGVGDVAGSTRNVEEQVRHVGQELLDFARSAEKSHCCAQT